MSKVIFKPFLTPYQAIALEMLNFSSGHNVLHVYPEAAMLENARSEYGDVMHWHALRAGFRHSLDEYSGGMSWTFVNLTSSTVSGMIKLATYDYFTKEEFYKYDTFSLIVIEGDIEKSIKATESFAILQNIIANGGSIIYL